MFTRPLTAIAVAGLLGPLLDSVNMINAPVIARERNIEVSEIKHSRPSDYQTLIRLTVITDRQSRDVAGTLFGGDKPRLVQIKGIVDEAELGRHMLYVTNRDKPGFIRPPGTLLGADGGHIPTSRPSPPAPPPAATALPPP